VRIIDALGPRPQAWLARESGINQTTLGDIIRKTMPNADAAIRLAAALDVPVDWLITGKVPVPSLRPVSDPDEWTIVPRYRLEDFTEMAKPEPAETIPLRKDWLNRAARVATNLWITQLPATMIEDIGEEGDDILCRDVVVREQEGVYLYFFDGMPIVRKFKGPMIGQLASGDRAWMTDPEDPPGMRIAARILGTIKLRPL
jgi:transcriptional regulator with XRE-family HTH domain